MASMSRASRRAHSPEKRACLCANVAGQLSPFVGRGRFKDRGDSERMIEAVIHRLKIETRRPENRLRLGGKLKSSLRVAQQDVPLQLQDPVKAGNERNAASSRGAPLPIPPRRLCTKPWMLKMTSWPNLYLRTKSSAPADSSHTWSRGSPRAIRSVRRC